MIPSTGNRERWAEISECGRYRYTLGRQWDPDPAKPAALWIMLNPSTADDVEDDQTIRRCTDFSRAWGCGGMAVYNLFAFRSSSPQVLVQELRLGTNVVGPENDLRLEVAAEVLLQRATTEGCSPSIVVAAWGAHGGWPPFAARAEQVTARFRSMGFKCLGRTANGHPRHPLYVRKLTPLEPYS